MALLMEELLAASAPEGWSEVALVPVPSSRRGRRTRGFETAVEIAKHLAGRRSTSVWSPLVQIGRVSQKKLDFEGRVAHASHSILIEHAADVLPRRAILVDDVFTTGATLSRCAELLKNRGVQEVGAVVFVMEEE